MENVHRNFKWKDSPGWSSFLQKALSDSLGTAPDKLPPPDPDDPSFKIPTFGTADDIKEILSSAIYQEQLKTISPLQIEIFLDQAAELFDRASRARERIAVLRVSAFQNTIELLEFWKLDPIHEREIQAGRYSAPVEEKRAQAKASANQLQALSEELKIINDFMKWFNQDTQSALIQNSMKVTVGSTTPGGTGGGNLDQYPPDVTTSVRAQHLYSWCGIIHESDVKQRGTSFAAQQANLTSAVPAAQERARGDERMAKYMEDTLSYQLQRVEVARQLFEYKLMQSQSSGGALAYRDQIGPLIVSARNDTAHALARLERAVQGMRQLFGYTASPVGSSPDFDIYMQRARDAINWHRSFCRKDDTLTIPISLKRVSGVNWQENLRRLQWDFTITDEEQDSSLPSMMLRDRRLARIRGITAYFDGSFAEHETFQVKIQPPSDSFIRWASGALHKLPAQKGIPFVWLGRVASRSSTRQPEIGGAVTLLNTSPIGKWQISIAPRSAEGGLPNDLFQHLNDVIIEISLVVQSKTAGG